MADGVSVWIGEPLASRIAAFGNANVANFAKLREMFETTGNERPMAFVGAGVSAGLYPGWLELLERLARRAVDIDVEAPAFVERVTALGQNAPLEAASLVREALGSQFANSLKSVFENPDKRCTHNHEQLLRLPFKALVTTNYDDCLTWARRREYGERDGVGPVLTHADADLLLTWSDQSAFKGEAPPLLHLHGSYYVPETLILDEQAYRGIYYRDQDGKPEWEQFRKVFGDLWLLERLVLVGFSGNDPMIRLVAQQTREKFSASAAEPRHIAIIPLELDKRDEARERRRYFMDNFGAWVVFFDPAPNADEPEAFGDLTAMLRALAATCPSERQREIRQQREAATAALKAAIGEEARRALLHIAPATAATLPSRPVHEVFWVPSVGKSWTSVGREPVASAVDASSVDSKSVADVKPLPVMAGDAVRTSLHVVVADGGAGKTVFAHLLALRQIGEPGLAGLDEIAAELEGRDIPLSINLRLYAEQIVSPLGSRESAIRTILGAASPRQVANVGASRVVIILDSLENLLWSAWKLARRFGAEEQERAVVADLIGIVRRLFPGAPIVATARPFAAKWLRDFVGQTMPMTFYDIGKFGAPDITDVACVHLHGRRAGTEDAAADPQIAKLLGNASLRRFVSAPLFVARTLKAMQQMDDTQEFTVRQVVSAYFEHRIHRETAGGEEPPFAHAFLRSLAYRVVASGNTILSADDIDSCGREMSLNATAAHATTQWLVERTEILVAEAGGGISFAHEWDAEYLAAEVLNMSRSLREIVALAEQPRWQNSVVIAADLARVSRGVELASALLDAGRIVVGVESAKVLLPKLDAAGRTEILERVGSLDLADADTRLSLVATLAQFDVPERARPLVRLAFPFSASTTDESIERVSARAAAALDYCVVGERDLQDYADYARRGSELELQDDAVGEDALQLGFRCPERTFGYGWGSASIVLDARQHKDVAGPGYAFANSIAEQIQRLSGDAIVAIARAAFDVADVAPQVRLIALTLLLEKLRESSETGPDSVPSGGIATLVRGLRVAVSDESPAFIVGLCNAAMIHLRSLCSAEERQTLFEARRRAVKSFLRRYEQFILRVLDRAGIDESKRQPRLDVTKRIKRSLTMLATRDPQQEKADLPRPRSLLDRFVAKRGHLIHKLKAKDTTGRWAYYFVLVSIEGEAAFLKSIEGDGNVNLEDYGRVIASCYGEDPSDDTRALLRDRYGFDI